MSLLAILLAASAVPQPGRLVDGIVCPSDPHETYALYLPSTYSKAKRHPLLFVFDPRSGGAAAAEVFREAAEELGMIVASSNSTLSDGAWEPNARAVRAMWPDVRAGYSVDPQRIYAAGFSGTHTVAWLLARDTGQLAGILAVGARMREESLADPPRVPWFGATGDRDFNHLEMRRIAQALSEKAIDQRLEVFEGEHQWLPPELARTGLRWLELLASKAGRRPPDPMFEAAALRDDLQRARALEDLSERPAAVRFLESAVRTHTGLSDTAELQSALDRLRASPELKREQKDERKWESWEREQVAHTGAALASLAASEESLPPAPAASRAGIDSLLSRARGSGREAAASRRVLVWLRAQAAFYMWRDLDASGSLRQAALFKGIACEIAPDRAALKLGYAIALAKAGDRKAAIASLGKALDQGFSDRSALEQEPLLAPLLSVPEIRRRLGPKPETP